MQNFASTKVCVTNSTLLRINLWPNCFRKYFHFSRYNRPIHLLHPPINYRDSETYLKYCRWGNVQSELIESLLYSFLASPPQLLRADTYYSN